MRIDPDNGAHMCAVMRLLAMLKQNVKKFESLEAKDILNHGIYDPTDETVGITIGSCRLIEKVDPGDA